MEDNNSNNTINDEAVVGAVVEGTTQIISTFLLEDENLSLDQTNSNYHHQEDSLLPITVETEMNTPSNQEITFWNRFSNYLDAIQKKENNVDLQHNWTDVINNSIVNKIVLFCIMFLLGRFFICFLRRHFKDSQDPWKIGIIPLITPITIYCMFILFLSKPIADVSSFGVLLGIISLLQTSAKTISSKETGVKLIIKEQSVIKCTLWFEDINFSVQEVRDKIAIELDILPPIRVCIESGKGQFIDPSSTQQLLPLLNNSHESLDFFGGITAYVNITITDIIESKDDEFNTSEGKAASNFIKDLLNSKENIKYGTDVQMHARVQSSAVDLVTFSISLIQGFAACSPNHQFPIPNTAGATVRILPWQPLTSSNSVSSINYTEQPTTSSRATTAENTNTNKNASTSTSTATHTNNNNKQTSSQSPTPSSKIPFVFDEKSLFSSFKISTAVKALIKDKDEIMLECEGKYLSVAKGWWLAWSSTIPRRSGAFVIEITERARTRNMTRQISDGFHKMKESLKESAFGKKDEECAVEVINKEQYLRAGDSFRLRSLKFPEYELGVTSVKIKDNFCYLGLRKMSVKASSDNEWSIGVRFTVRPNGMLNMTIPNLPAIPSISR